ncbi:hypothetical protein SDC9_167288 [bioreactor metagenome]|uniref:Uncharacterized protein n=1 Tax=bioreactor metagenome TaxID=1076179 RepID=A0A645G7K5_9ZZZZ
MISTVYDYSVIHEPQIFQTVDDSAYCIVNPFYACTICSKCSLMDVEVPTIVFPTPIHLNSFFNKLYSTLMYIVVVLWKGDFVHIFIEQFLWCSIREVRFLEMDTKKEWTSHGRISILLQPFYRFGNYNLCLCQWKWNLCCARVFKQILKTMFTFRSFSFPYIL